MTAEATVDRAGFFDRAGLRDTLTLILAGGQGERLYPLSRDRAKPAVPFGGSYRIIDFTLSNCLNSGFRRVYVLTQYKSLSLERHIRQGWNIFNEALGEFIVPIPPQQRLGGSWYQGTADAIFQNIYTLEQERPRFVLILSGDHVYRMDYARMLATHQESGADLTVACMEVGNEDAPHFGIAVTDGTTRMTRFVEKPKDPEALRAAGASGPGDRYLASMGVYLFDTESLVRRVSRDAKRDSSHDFGKDVIPTMVEEASVHVHRLPGAKGGGPPYWRDIGRLDAYFEAHCDLLPPAPAFDLFEPAWPIRTRPAQLPPLKIAGEGGITDSLLSPGCVLTGGRVVRSILGYGVEVREGASVRDSILLDDVRVGEGAILRRAIVDKRVEIPPGAEIGIDADADARRFTVTGSGVVVVPKGAPV